MDSHKLIIEIIGWSSTLSFLISILVPNRVNLHQLGLYTSVATAIYAYAHDAPAIWVKWIIAFFFHAYMIYKIKKGVTLPMTQMKP